MIRVDAEGPFAEYALELCSRFLGVELARAADGEPADVYHGNDAERPCRLRIPKIERYSVDDVPGADAAPVDDGPFPFDLFAALRFWLADEGNADAPEGAYDGHDRLAASHSAQERRGLRELPVVNAYLVHFGDWLAARLGATVSRPRCTVLLSHDVDEPLDPSVARRLSQVTLALRRGEPKIAYAYARSLPGEWRSRGGRHWLFSEVLDAEASHGFTSTFFFASRAARDDGASLYDVAYDVREPRFRRVFDEIRDRGAEVGLHLSYNAREGSAAMAAERAVLEGASGGPVRGGRHHYWHMARPFWRSLADHARAGLAYDASIAFNEAPGLRLGIAFPFRPWSPEAEAPIPALQLPTFAMDAPFFRDPATTVDAAVTRFAALLEPMKRFGGVASLDWHVRCAWPASPTFRRWGETYLAILDALAADPDVDVARCEEAWERFSPRGA